jgi:predicted SprT family Zn-dependent metalloprotease
MMGYQNLTNSEFTYEKFVETIAHEIAHCIIYDLYGEQRGHSEKQKLITSELKEYLLVEETIKILGDN